MQEKPPELTPEQKHAALAARWLEPEGVDFESPAAAEKYRRTAARLLDTIHLDKEPDRVPVAPTVGVFPVRYAGYTQQEAMYDYEKCSLAYEKYMRDFDPDTSSGMASPTPGRVYDILDYKLYAWPGHGLPAENSFQCIEGEYVYADEYDDLIRDPAHFFATRLFPRHFGGLDAWQSLPNYAHVQEIPNVGPSFAAFGNPAVQAAYQRLFEAGNEAVKWLGYVAAFDQKMKAAGYPGLAGGFSKAPFDVIGDTLRGTKGIMLDIYRQPEKLLEALDAITPMMIHMGAAAVRRSGRPAVMMPLHKGADGFLSDEQFRKFYWPSFKKLVMGLIDEGCIAYSFVEGGYNSRLEYLAEFPRGRTIWHFDATDMAHAKQVLGGKACITGNVPTSVLTVAGVDEVRDCVKRLVDVAASGGGYIMMNGAVLDYAKPENLHAMIDCTKEYGVYR